MIIIVMGVSGSGKTTVGRLLARDVGWKFYDADEFHSGKNIERMRRGIPLEDEDRLPWLERIRALVETALHRGEDAVIACSALKRSYRRKLRISPEVVFVYLKAGVPLAQERLSLRTGHFMSRELLQSQFDALEEPKTALVVDAGLTPEQIAATVRDRLSI